MIVFGSIKSATELTRRLLGFQLLGTFLEVCQIYPTFFCSLNLDIYFQKGPNNITSWDGSHLFSNSISPIKGSKSGAERWFLAQMAKSIQLFFAL